MPPGFRLRPARPKVLEADVVRASRDLLNLRGWRLKRLHVGRFQTLDGRYITGAPVGSPDFVAIHPRHAGFYIEFKRTHGGVVSAAWRLPVVVVSDVSELAEWLRERGVQGVS